MVIKKNKYGIVGPKKEFKRPLEIAPDLFDGRSGGDFGKRVKKGQKGWLLFGTVGLVGGSVTATVEREGKPPKQFHFSPTTSPGESFEIELGTDPLRLVSNGMLDYRFEILVKRLF